jgi:hypothetical protein
VGEVEMPEVIDAHLGLTAELGGVFLGQCHHSGVVD